MSPVTCHLSPVQRDRWKPVRHPLRITLERGWNFGRDPRRVNGVCLISPRGRVFEFRANPQLGCLARPYPDYQLQ